MDKKKTERDYLMRKGIKKEDIANYA